jgi:hypothetical protein
MLVSADRLRSLAIQQIVGSRQHELLIGLSEGCAAKFNHVFAGGAYTVPKVKEIFHAYHLTVELSLAVAAKTLNRLVPAQPGQILPANGNVLKNILRLDLDRVNAAVALAAWYTVDDWRWHTKGYLPGCPQHLAYGLVLRYPLVLLDFGRVYLDHDRSLLLETLTPDEIERCHQVVAELWRFQESG